MSINLITYRLSPRGIHIHVLCLLINAICTHYQVTVQYFSVCKYLAIELRDRLDETGKSKEVLETGHGIDPRKKKKIKYNTS